MFEGHCTQSIKKILPVDAVKLIKTPAVLVEV